jgi:phosphate transport system substrate-binding protein
MAKNGARCGGPRLTPIQEALVLLKLKAVLTVLVALGLGSAALTACGTPPKIIAGAGSDTTFWIMSGSTKTQGTPPPSPTKGISDGYNASQTAATTYEIPPVLNAPFPGPTFTVPKDQSSGASCTSDTVYNGMNPPPNGSSAGITALVNDTKGCIDFARSSRGAKSSDPSGLSFWAFALDAVTWVEFPSNTHNVHTLTPDQIKSIYTCDPGTGAPFISNWNQIPGASGSGNIIKYAPQTQAGTYAFVNSKLLGGATIDQNCNSSHLSNFLEEHDMRGVSNANKPNAIGFFSVGQWKAQQGGVLVDLRNGSQLQSINGVAPNGSTINTGPTRFFGTRYIYNVTKDTSPQLDATLDFVGVKSGGPGYICSGNGASTVTTFGGFNLPLGGTGAGLPNSRCRLNPTPL